MAALVSAYSRMGKASLTASSCAVGGMIVNVGGALEAIVVLSYHDKTSHWGLWETAPRDIRCSLEKPAFLAGFSHCINGIWL